MNKLNLKTRYYVGPVELTYTEEHFEEIEKRGYKMDCKPGGLMYRFKCDDNSRIKGLYEYYMPDGSIGLKVGVRNGAIGFGLKNESEENIRIYNIVLRMVRDDRNTKLRRLRLMEIENNVKGISNE